MNYEKLIANLYKHPFDIMQNGFGKEATVNSYYLYEVHNMHYDFYGSHVWIFNSIEEFVEFLPAIVFSDVAVNCENNDFIKEYGNLDYTDRFSYYKSLSTRKWDEAECKKFIAEYNETDEIELIEFGKVSDLLNVSQEVFDRCEKVHATLDEINDQGLSTGIYKIMHQFHNVSKLKPALNQKLFLDMIENWEY